MEKWPSVANTISGSGRYGIVGCGPRLFLFDTAMQRARILKRWDFGTCGMSACSGKHRLIELPAIDPLPLQPKPKEGVCCA
jgi:hypothetical protein